MLYVFSYDCGSGTTRVRSNNTVELTQWNVIKIGVTGRHSSVQLNSAGQIRRRAKVRITNQSSDIFIVGSELYRKSPCTSWSGGDD